MKPSLHGLRILNTRPKDQAQSLNHSIKEAGGIFIDCPTLEIIASSNNWIKLLPSLHQVHHAVFISPNAVHHGFSQLNEHARAWPSHINVIAIGQTTAVALKKLNIHVHDIPDIPNSEHLLKLVSLQDLKNQTVLLFKGEGGRTLIEECLLQRKANLISLSVYQRVMPKIGQQFINSLWRDDLVDIILLTSEQSIHNIFKMFCKEAHNWIQNKTCLVISDRLATSASLFGIKKIIISHPHRMLSALLEHKD